MPVEQTRDSGRPALNGTSHCPMGHPGSLEVLKWRHLTSSLPEDGCRTAVLPNLQTTRDGGKELNTYAWNERVKATVSKEG